MAYLGVDTAGISISDDNIIAHCNDILGDTIFFFFLIVLILWNMVGTYKDDCSSHRGKCL